MKTDLSPTTIILIFVAGIALIIYGGIINDANQAQKAKDTQAEVDSQNNNSDK